MIVDEIYLFRFQFFNYLDKSADLHIRLQSINQYGMCNLVTLLCSLGIKFFDFDIIQYTFGLNENILSTSNRFFVINNLNHWIKTSLHRFIIYAGVFIHSIYPIKKHRSNKIFVLQSLNPHRIDVLLPKKLHASNTLCFRIP